MAVSRDHTRGPGLRLDRVRIHRGRRPDPGHIRLDRLRDRRQALGRIRPGRLPVPVRIRRGRHHRIRRTGAAGGMLIRSRQRSPSG